ncbi:MAG: hypothetical protein ACNA8W_26505, partial [Bradymonadaceae bacterium]
MIKDHFVLMFAFVAILFGAGACLQDFNHECQRASDCLEGDFCRAGQCILAVGVARHSDHGSVRTGGSVFESDADADFFDSNAGPTSPPLDCPDALAPTVQRLVLNEALVNVPTGPDGDANGDGV